MDKINASELSLRFMSDLSEPSEMLICLRKKKGITAIELAARMGVSPSYVAKLELGEIKPTQEQIEVMKAFIHGKL